MHKKLIKLLRNIKVLSGFAALTIVLVLFFSSSLRVNEFRRSCVGEVRSKAAGNGPDVKPAPR